jgi:large subunit ribosomal protein L1
LKVPKKAATKTAAVGLEPAAETLAEDTKEPKAKVLKSIGPSKRYQSITKKVENKPYPLGEAVDLVKDLATAKFDETIEASFRLGIDSSQTNLQVRGSVRLPHGTGRKVKVLVFATGPAAESAKKSGADLATEQIAARIEKGSVPYDLVLATPEEMPKIAKLARVLGVRGLMPNPKSGTVTTNPAQTISERSAGLVDFRSGSSPTIHLAIGKASFAPAQVKENLIATYQAIQAAKPSKVLGSYIRSVTLASTMGPGVKLDLESLK